jgi:hypothetical protein
MTLAITINLILSAIVFAAIITLISRSILSSRPTSAAIPARAQRARGRFSVRPGLGARVGLDSRA